MPYIPVAPERKAEYNSVVSHPLQSYEWGEFREKTQVKVIRRGLEKNGTFIDGFQVTIHNIPHTPFTIGYLPKSNMPQREMIEELQIIGQKEKCVFIQLEPNIEHKANGEEHFRNLGLIQSAHPLFTKYTFILDLSLSEEDLLKNMHSKTRYNIRVAEKKGVVVTEDDSEKAFKTYLALTDETTTRQKFYAHTKKYHTLMWETLRNTSDPHGLSAHLLTATYNKIILVSWIVFIFQDTLYYPYGASSNEHREVMASNFMMWEAIKFGKRLGLKKFDMWGALSESPDVKDPWYGFHRFKSGYAPRHVTFMGSYDLVINPALYEIYKIVDKLRWFYLRLKK